MVGHNPPACADAPVCPPPQDKQLRVSALHCAAIGGHPAVTELLIKAGADLRLRDGVRIVP